jgi:hypothetical protein
LRQQASTGDRVTIQVKETRSGQANREPGSSATMSLWAAQGGERKEMSWARAGCWASHGGESDWERQMPSGLGGKEKRRRKVGRGGGNQPKRVLKL